MRDLLEQLNKCHKENIIHSNIKPENIKICEQSDKAILIDFALDNIKLQDKITSFTAPEIIKQQPITKKSDMWSMGILLFGMINEGGMPFQSYSQSELSYAITRGDFMFTQAF